MGDAYLGTHAPQLPHKLLQPHIRTPLSCYIMISQNGIRDIPLLAWLAHTRATPVGPPRNTSPTYSPGIQGRDFRWLELLVAGYPPSSSHSNSSSHLKSKPCIPEEYVGLVFLSTGVAGVFGVALVSQGQVLQPIFASLAP